MLAYVMETGHLLGVRRHSLAEIGCRSAHSWMILSIYPDRGQAAAGFDIYRAAW